MAVSKELDRAAKLVAVRWGLAYGISADRGGKGKGYAIVQLTWFDCFTCSEQPVAHGATLHELLCVAFSDLQGHAYPTCPRFNPAEYTKREYTGPKCACHGRSDTSIPSVQDYRLSKILGQAGESPNQ